MFWRRELLSPGHSLLLLSLIINGMGGEESTIKSHMEYMYPADVLRASFSSCFSSFFLLNDRCPRARCQPFSRLMGVKRLALQWEWLSSLVYWWNKCGCSQARSRLELWSLRELDVRSRRQYKTQKQMCSIVHNREDTSSRQWLENAPDQGHQACALFSSSGSTLIGFMVS